MYVTAQGPVSEMTYTVSSGTLNCTMPYHTVYWRTLMLFCLGFSSLSVVSLSATHVPSYLPLPVIVLCSKNTVWKKALGETQTLRAGCSKAEPKIFAPPLTAFSGSQYDQNLISWRWSLPSPTDPVWWRSMLAISSYRGNRPTHKQTGPITIHCAAKLSAQCN